MKTRTIFPLAILFFTVSVLSLTGCKKDKIDEGNSDSSSMEQLSNDENNAEAVMDDATQDVENVLSYHSLLKSTEGLPCNATVDSVAVSNDTITILITYNGLNCNGTRNRTGQIEIKKKVGTHWGQAGATIRYRYINFSVTRVATGRSITLNGTKTFVNVNGGFIWQVGNPLVPSVTHQQTGSMQITFDNGDTRNWNIARQRTYTGTQGNLLMTVDGLGTAGDYSNLVTWGLNRKGEQFYTQITQSVVLRQQCGWDPVLGVKVHQIPSDNKSATITFGYNNNNEPITGDECPTRFRIDWQKGTHSGTKYLQLP
ncbi:MAG: hypothetical protein HXX13_10460 [Bacteroidetes bacterium]|nr:hypothetical protein [Bacteroidota bacterium]